MSNNKIDLAYTRYLSPDGRLTGELPPWADDFNLLTRLYRQMVLTRLFDQKAVALQRTGRTGHGIGSWVCDHGLLSRASDIGMSHHIG